MLWANKFADEHKLLVQRIVNLESSNESMLAMIRTLEEEHDVLKQRLQLAEQRPKMQRHGEVHHEQRRNNSVNANEAKKTENAATADAPRSAGRRPSTNTYRSAGTKLEQGGQTLREYLRQAEDLVCRSVSQYKNSTAREFVFGLRQERWRAVLEVKLGKDREDWTWQKVEELVREIIEDIERRKKSKRTLMTSKVCSPPHM